MPTILIIEDRTVDRTFLTTLLETAGHLVLAASDGEEGLGLLVERHPDLVISDILIATGNDDELVRRMRNISGLEAIPIMFLAAAHLEREARLLGSRCGAVDIVTTPMAPEVVLAKVRAALPLDVSSHPAAAATERPDEVNLSARAAGQSAVYADPEASRQRTAAFIDVSRKLAMEHDLGPPSGTVEAERAIVQPAARAAAETVLVIEDEEAVRCLIRVLLERAGYQVIDAECAEQGESLFLENPDAIDLVISDVVMPGTSGPSLLRKLTAHHPGLKALFISGYPAGESGYFEEEAEEDSVLASEFAFLQKPFSAINLVRKVRQVLDS